MTEEWIGRARAISKQQIAPNFGVGDGRGEDGESVGACRALNHDGENGHRSWSAVAVSQSVALARQLCILGERKRSRQANGNEFYLLLACAASPARGAGILGDLKRRFDSHHIVDL